MNISLEKKLMQLATLIGFEAWQGSDGRTSIKSSRRLQGNNFIAGQADEKEKKIHKKLS